MNVLVVCVLVACSPPPRPKPPERDAPDAKPVAPRPGKQFPPPPTGFATADFVTTTGGELTAYAIVDGKLVATGMTTLAKDDAKDSMVTYFNLGFGGWADRDHLFLITGHREVVMVTATAITEVPIPSEDRFKTAKPTNNPDGELDAGDTFGLLGPHTGLLVTEGEVWWGACPWGLVLDGFQCREYAYARLWPTVTFEVGQTPVNRRADAWVSSPPPGIVMTTHSQGVTCDQGGAKLVIGPDRNHLGEEIDTARWVSASPPRLLVTYGRQYMSLVVERWTLHDGCTARPIATGYQAVAGPGHLWIARDGEGDAERQVVYRGGTPLGEVPGHAIYLRPLANSAKNRP